MAVNVQPIYPKTPFTWTTKFSNQVLPRFLGSETPTLLGTVADCGGLIHNIEAVPLGDNVATLLLLFLRLDEGSGSYFLITETALPLITASTITAPIAKVTISLPDVSILSDTGSRKAMHLPPNASIYAGLTVAIAAGVNLVIRGGEY